VIPIDDFGTSIKFLLLHRHIHRVNTHKFYLNLMNILLKYFFPTMKDVGVKLNFAVCNILICIPLCVISLDVFLLHVYNRNCGIRNVLNLSRFLTFPASLGSIFSIIFFLFFKSCYFLLLLLLFLLI
jgi:hypothetical protein